MCNNLIYLFVIIATACLLQSSKLTQAGTDRCQQAVTQVELPHTCTATAPPTLVSCTASDAGHQPGISTGDTVLCIFDVDTNRPSLTNMGRVLAWSAPVGSVTGAWVSTRNMLVTLTNPSSASYYDTRIGNLTVSVLSSANIRTSNGASNAAVITTFKVSGSWGAFPPPQVTAATAFDTGFQPGLGTDDTLQLTFDVPTTRPPVDSLAAATVLLGNSSSVPCIICGKVVGQWTSATRLVLRFISVTGLDPLTTAVNALRIASFAGSLLSADLSSAPTQLNFLVTGGSWGLRPVPVVSGAVARNAGNAPGISQGDSVTFTFDSATNGPALPASALAWSSAGFGWSPAWADRQTLVVTITSVNSTLIADGSAAIGRLAVRFTGWAGLKCVDSSSSPISTGWMLVTGTWGSKTPLTIISATALNGDGKPGIGFGDLIRVVLSDMSNSPTDAQCAAAGGCFRTSPATLRFTTTWATPTVALLRIEPPAPGASSTDFAALTRIGLLSLQLVPSSALRTVDLTAGVTATRVQVTGTWGIMPSPRIVTCTAYPGGSSPALDDGDYLDVEFDSPTNTAILGRLEIARFTTFGSVNIGAGTAGRWISNSTLRLTVQAYDGSDEQQAAASRVRFMQFSILDLAGVQSQDGSSLAAATSCPVLTGSWSFQYSTHSMLLLGSAVPLAGAGTAVAAVDRAAKSLVSSLSSAVQVAVVLAMPADATWTLQLPPAASAWDAATTWPPSTPLAQVLSSSVHMQVVLTSANIPPSAADAKGALLTSVASELVTDQNLAKLTSALAAVPGVSASATVLPLNMTWRATNAPHLGPQLISAIASNAGGQPGVNTGDTLCLSFKTPTNQVSDGEVQAISCPRSDVVVSVTILSCTDMPVAAPITGSAIAATLAGCADIGALGAQVVAQQPGTWHVTFLPACVRCEGQVPLIQVSPASACSVARVFDGATLRTATSIFAHLQLSAVLFSTATAEWVTSRQLCITIGDVPPMLSPLETRPGILMVSPTIGSGIRSYDQASQPAFGAVVVSGSWGAATAPRLMGATAWNGDDLPGIGVGDLLVLEFSVATNQPPVVAPWTMVSVTPPPVGAALTVAAGQWRSPTTLELRIVSALTVAPSASELEAAQVRLIGGIYSADGLTAAAVNEAIPIAGGFGDPYSVTSLGTISFLFVVMLLLLIGAVAKPDVALSVREYLVLAPVRRWWRVRKLVDPVYRPVLGLDLGTYRVVAAWWDPGVYAPGEPTVKGKVLSKSIVASAREAGGRKILIGDDAAALASEQTKSIRVYLNLMRQLVDRDFDDSRPWRRACELQSSARDTQHGPELVKTGLQQLFRSLANLGLLRVDIPSAIGVAVPVMARSTHRVAIKEAAAAAGLGQVFCLESPLATAVALLTREDTATLAQGGSLFGVVDATGSNVLKLRQPRRPSQNAIVPEAVSLMWQQTDMLVVDTGAGFTSFANVRVDYGAGTVSLQQATCIPLGYVDVIERLMLNMQSEHGQQHRWADDRERMAFRWQLCTNIPFLKRDKPVSVAIGHGAVRNITMEQYLVAAEPVFQELTTGWRGFWQTVRSSISVGSRQLRCVLCSGVSRFPGLTSILEDAIRRDAHLEPLQPLHSETLQAEGAALWCGMTDGRDLNPPLPELHEKTADAVRACGTVPRRWRVLDPGSWLNISVVAPTAAPVSEDVQEPGQSPSPAAEVPVSQVQLQVPDTDVASVAASEYSYVSGFMGLSAMDQGVVGALRAPDAAAQQSAFAVPLASPHRIKLPPLAARSDADAKMTQLEERYLHLAQAVATQGTGGAAAGLNSERLTFGEL